MKFLSSLAALVLVLAFVLMVTPAKATPITSLPGGTVVPMPAVNYHGTGPQEFGPGITWTSSYAGSGFGWTGTYGFNPETNGGWNGALGPMAGLNGATWAYASHPPQCATCTMTFAFDTPVLGVGGFINYALVPTGGPAVIAIYDSDMNLLESTVVDFNLGGGYLLNGGYFLGFLQDKPTISYFTLSDSYIGITDLTIVPCSQFPGGGETEGCYPGGGHGGEFVPDPASTLLLFGLSLAGLAASRWRRP